MTPKTKKAWLVVPSQKMLDGNKVVLQKAYTVDAIASYYSQDKRKVSMVLPRTDLVLEAIASNQNFTVQKDVTLFCTLDIGESGLCVVLEKESLSGCEIPPINPGSCGSTELFAYTRSSQEEVDIIDHDGPEPVGNQIKILGGTPHSVKVKVSSELKRRKIRVVSLPAKTDSMMQVIAGNCPELEIQRIMQTGESSFVHERVRAQVTNKHGVILLNNDGYVVNLQETGEVSKRPINAKLK